MPRVYNTELYYTRLSITVVLRCVNFAALKEIIYTVQVLNIEYVPSRYFFTLISNRIINVFPLFPGNPPLLKTLFYQYINDHWIQTHKTTTNLLRFTFCIKVLILIIFCSCILLRFTTYTEQTIPNDKWHTQRKNEQ